MKFVPQFSNNWIGVLSLLTSLLVARVTVAGGDNDAKATTLADQAVFEDYLNLNLDAAVSKLKTAIELCDTDCSPPVKARIFRDLGVIRIAAQQNSNEGLEMFVKALRVDPNIELDEDLTTPDVEQAFDRARKQVSSLENAGATTSAGASGPPAQPTHSPPSEQTVNTPVPLYFQVPSSEYFQDASIAKVFYRAFGAPQFSSRELKRKGNAFSGQISCLEVGGVEGTLKYYFVVYSSDEQELASLGSADAPFEVAIKHEIRGPAPSLPGEAAPQRCNTKAPAAAEDCPPEFPGCDAEGDWTPADDLDEAQEEFSRHSVSISFQQEFVFQSGENVCGLHNDFAIEWECFDDGGNLRDPYLASGHTGLPTITGAAVVSDGGNFTDGFEAGTRRVLLGYAYRFRPELTLGARLGFAFGGGPQYVTEDPTFDRAQFFPVHAELEVGYWPFGATAIVSPFVKLSGGIAQFDAKSRVEVLLTGQPELDACAGACDGLEAELDAWNKQGLGFAGATLGASVGTPQISLLLEARYLLSFPTSSYLKGGSSIGASAGIQLGF